MEKWFLNFAKKVQIIILAVGVFLTIGIFTGAILTKAYAADLYWLTILLTCIGMAALTVSVCLFIYFITGKPQLGESTEIEEQPEPKNDQEDNQDMGEPYTQG